MEMGVRTTVLWSKSSHAKENMRLGNHPNAPDSTYVTTPYMSPTMFKESNVITVT